MARTVRASGVTLIEAMVSMMVLVLGSMALLGLHKAGVGMNADARITTRATAIAEDLVTQMQTWDFTNDPRLVNINPANDGDFADSAGAFEHSVASLAGNQAPDHAEAELEAQALPYTWSGIPTATVQALGFSRYWNVAEVDFDPTGVLNARRVAVIVQWQRGDGAWRRIVLITGLRNPAATN